MNDSLRIVRFGEFEIDDALLELRRSGRRLPLDPKPLTVLRYLIANRSRVVSKNELLERCWPGVTVEEASVFRAIKQIRLVLSDAGPCIQTFKRRGYRFSGDVELDLRGAELFDCVSRALPGIAVLRFAALGEFGGEVLGESVASELMIELHEHCVLRVVPRELVQDAAGRLSLERAAAIGVRYAAAGSACRTSASFEVAAWLADLHCHRIVWSLRAQATASGSWSAIRELTARLAASLCLAVLQSGIACGSG